MPAIVVLLLTGRASCVALLLVVVPLLPACQLFLPVGTVLGYEILTEIQGEFDGYSARFWHI